MTKKRTSAAAIWARLERLLIETCGLPNGRMLDVARPRLIRSIGGMIDAPALAVGVADDAADVPAHHVVEDRRSPRHAVVRQNNPRVKVRRVNDQHAPSRHWDDTIVDAKLSALLEQSCSRRTGYDGDDAVGYER